MKNESEKGGAELCSSFSSHSGWHRGPQERVLLLSHHVSVATSNYTMTRSVWRRTGWGVIAVLAISSFRIGVIMSWSWHVDREWSPGTTTTPWKYKPQNSLAALRSDPGPLFVKFEVVLFSRAAAEGKFVLILWCDVSGELECKKQQENQSTITAVGELNPSHFFLNSRVGCLVPVFCTAFQVSLLLNSLVSSQWLS